MTQDSDKTRLAPSASAAVATGSLSTLHTSIKMFLIASVRHVRAGLASINLHGAFKAFPIISLVLDIPNEIINQYTLFKNWRRQKSKDKHRTRTYLKEALPSLLIALLFNIEMLSQVAFAAAFVVAGPIFVLTAFVLSFIKSCFEARQLYRQWQATKKAYQAYVENMPDTPSEAEVTKKAVFEAEVKALRRNFALKALSTLLIAGSTISLGIMMLGPWGPIATAVIYGALGICQILIMLNLVQKATKAKSQTISATDDDVSNSTPDDKADAQPTYEPSSYTPMYHVLYNTAKHQLGSAASHLGLRRRSRPQT